MKFRIIKEDGIYFAEYKKVFLWWYVSGSASKNMEETRKACKKFEKAKVVEVFEL